LAFITASICVLSRPGTLLGLLTSQSGCYLRADGNLDERSTEMT
jgi:hypothetical protein